MQKGGKGRFAGVTIRAEAGEFDGVHWAPEVSHFARAQYAGDVVAGIADARRWHLAKGGTDASIEVSQIEEILSDTTPDAVRLAATVAAWKALGNSEAELRFDQEGDRWVPIEL
ncbi:hypothetical protein OKA05_10195 [Luteolibacter arcticus]|uniref:Uncharacterized protein n=1 Tax=Luteolibacter arcticus TaxID=1581411 RepID=A0ABT3GH26_9BACT|nr:hypothetical protein [Luteolibacter arcticus]MCW1922922.1 hypothetical protein [Luteolibacter arcticus]